MNKNFAINSPTKQQLQISAQKILSKLEIVKNEILMEALNQNNEEDI